MNLCNDMCGLADLNVLRSSAMSILFADAGPFNTQKQHFLKDDVYLSCKETFRRNKLEAACRETRRCKTGKKGRGKGCQGSASSPGR